MPLTPAICPQCGGNIEVDNAQDAAICKFCGTPFVVEKAINNYNADIINNNFSGTVINMGSANTDNLLIMAENAIAAGNGQEAIEYINRTLENNPELSKAWFLKMKAVESSSTLSDPKVNETIAYGKNAIKFSPEDKQIENDVYKYFLGRASSILLIAIAQMEDTDKIKTLSGMGISAMQGVAKGDSAMRTILLNVGDSALKLKMQIPDEYIKVNEEIQDGIVVLAKLYGSLCEADAKRIEIYGTKLLDSAIEARKEKLKKFKAGLPEDKASQITTEKVSANNDGGCYIATCVYGSYDCPQVWTLRRYRDNVLRKSWYGKLFITIYYATSPTIVKWFGNMQVFKTLCKSALDKKIHRLQDKGIANTPYQDINY